MVSSNIEEHSIKTMGKQKESMSVDLTLIERSQKEIKEAANKDKYNISTKRNVIKKKEFIVEHMDEDSEEGELGLTKEE